MKRVLLLPLLLLSMLVSAQQGANDILFTTNGEIIQGKVTKVTANTISFSYPGETLVNEIETSNLEKIVFSSGRTQNFDAQKTTSASSAGAPVQSSPKDTVMVQTTIPKEEIYLGPDSKAIDNNVLALVPMSYYEDGTYSREVSRQLSQFATEYLSTQNQSLPIEVQSLDATIEKLMKAKVSFQKLNETSVEDLQRILGAGYLITMEVKTTQTAQAKKEGGFFGESQTQTDSSGSKRFDMELVLYGKSGTETYSTKFSDERSHANGMGKAGSASWKKGAQYVLDQVLNLDSL
ncbi:MAG: hypothetical protein AAFU57_05760 [Bacteroidota bacterium]